MNRKIIGTRVKQCREQLGLTQEELAEKADVTVNYISSIECGISFPRYEKLVALLNALEVPADAIFCDVVDKSIRYRSDKLSEEISKLSLDVQKQVYNIIEKLVQSIS